MAQEKAIWIEQVDGRARHDALGDRTVHVVDGDSEDGERRQVTVPERDAYYLVELETLLDCCVELRLEWGSIKGELHYYKVLQLREDLRWLLGLLGESFDHLSLLHRG